MMLCGIPPLCYGRLHSGKSSKDSSPHIVQHLGLEEPWGVAISLSPAWHIETESLRGPCIVPISWNLEKLFLLFISLLPMTNNNIGHHWCILVTILTIVNTPATIPTSTILINCDQGMTWLITRCFSTRLGNQRLLRHFLRRSPMVALCLWGQQWKPLRAAHDQRLTTSIWSIWILDLQWIDLRLEFHFHTWLVVLDRGWLSVD